MLPNGELAFRKKGVLIQTNYWACTHIQPCICTYLLNHTHMYKCTHIPYIYTWNLLMYIHTHIHTYPSNIHTSPIIHACNMSLKYTLLFILTCEPNHTHTHTQSLTYTHSHTPSRGRNIWNKIITQGSQEDWVGDQLCCELAVWPWASHPPFCASSVKQEHKNLL